MTSKFTNYDYPDDDKLAHCFSNIKKTISISSNEKSLTQGYVKEFDIINECGIIVSIKDGKEFYITPETFFYNIYGVTILSLYSGEKVLFDYSKSNDIKIIINVYSCDGKEDIRNNLEDQAWEKYYEECGDCIWCGKSCHDGNHEF
uniref:YopX domain-containing protein n=1 Tax=Strongyloides papillosus TaxID=174720 RepID=A0A0N5B3C5_STREA